MAEIKLCCCFFFTIFISMILQAVGFLSPYWVSWDDCDAQGLFYYLNSNVTAGCYGPGNYTSESTLTMEAIAFVFHLIVFNAIIFSVCCCDCDDECEIFMRCTLVFYPVAGILSLVGCSKMSNIDVSDFSYGSSYIMCLISGIYVVLQMALLCYGCFKASKDDDDDDDDGGNSYPTTVATTPSSGQVLSTFASTEHVGVEVSERQEVHVSNGMMFVQKMRVMNVVRLVR